MNEEAKENPASELEIEIQALQRVIRKRNSRWKRLVILEAMGLAIAAPLAYLWMILVLDTVLHLSMGGRFLASLVFLAAVIWQTRRFLISWRQTNFSDEQVALAIERNTLGGLENRMINSVQLAARQTGVPGAARLAVVRENYQRLKQLHIEQAAHSRPAMIRIGLATLAVVAGLTFRVLLPERFSIAATRILLPFANVASVYRTELFVEPGDTRCEAGQDVRITIQIRGRIPTKLLVISRSEGERVTEEIPVPSGSSRVEHVFLNLRKPLSYAIRGGDYVTPYYTIQVPVPSDLQKLEVVYTYPEYTRLSDRTQEGTSGDMQALFGTEAKLRLFLNRPAESVALVFEPAHAEPGVAYPVQEEDRLTLKKEGAAEFSGTLIFDRSRRYRIETSQENQRPALGQAYDIKVMPDQPPEWLLIGIVDGSEVTLDSVAALKVVGRDDFGLVEGGVFFRLRASAEASWEKIESWPIDPPARAFERDWILPMAGLGAAEGDEVEIAARGRDNCPLREGMWQTGQRYIITLGGEASRLQIEYERILKIEKDLARLIQGILDVSDAMSLWIRKLDPGAGLRWDDEENLKQLAEGMTGLAATQSEYRSMASSVAREMPETAGSLKLSVGLLADTEMIRAIQMIEGVAARENPQQKRSVLGEARLTQERTVRSLRNVLNAYIQFRKDWELENMLPFIRMLTQRQTSMNEESLAYAELPAESAGDRLRAGTSRRQRKLKDLVELTQTAFTGIAERKDVVGDRMAQAFTEASDTLAKGAVKPDMDQAAEHLQEGEWGLAASLQEKAASGLDTIYQRLRQAQTDVAREMMEELKALAEDNLEAQAEIKKMDPGSGVQMMHGDLEVMGEIVNMVAMAEELKNRRFETQPDSESVAEGQLSDYISTHVGSGRKMHEEERDFSIMTLASQPGSQAELMSGFKTDDKIEISLIQEYQDVVGDLLDEADDVREEYQSIVNMLLGQDIEAGSASQAPLSMASVSAAAPTGNMKPDTEEHGGASRIGRQGARATGIAVGDESISRRGRDEAQESSQEIPDTPAPPIKETMSEDPATDHSTGVGGRELESEQQSSFSVKDVGEWKDEMTDRMKDPQSTHQIVERAGAPLAAETADLLRAMESQQEQLIERIKRVKKELNNLYLPTDHLDEAIRSMNANLDRLRESPDLENFRLQIEALDRMIGAVMVFDRPSSEFQPSLARQAVVRGEILDEPQGPTLPGYEDAVKRYYERLSNP